MPAIKISFRGYEIVSAPAGQLYFIMQDSQVMDEATSIVKAKRLIKEHLDGLVDDLDEEGPVDEDGLEPEEDEDGDLEVEGEDLEDEDGDS